MGEKILCIGLSLPFEWLILMTLFRVEFLALIKYFKVIKEVLEVYTDLCLVDYNVKFLREHCSEWDIFYNHIVPCLRRQSWPLWLEKWNRYQPRGDAWYLPCDNCFSPTSSLSSLIFYFISFFFSYFFAEGRSTWECGKMMYVKGMVW